MDNNIKLGFCLYMTIKERGINMGFPNNNGYTSDKDVCPNCGATKVFSALTCPSCGMDYAEAVIRQVEKAAQANAAPAFSSIEPEKPAPGKFDPNASFAKYKNNLEKKDNPDSAENAEGTAESTETNTPAAEPPIDPIAKKLSELSAQNGGMYSERKYRTSSGDEADNVPAQTDNNGWTSFQGTGVPGTGQIGLGNKYGSAQSGTPSSSGMPGASYGGSTRQFGNSVSNRYEAYKNDMENRGSSEQYASPYSRGAFNAQPEVKQSTFKKIFPFLIILVLLGIGVGVYLYIDGLNSNGKGVKYTTGYFVDENGNKVTPNAFTVSSGAYINEWAEIRLEYDKNKEFYIFNSLMESMMTADQKEKFELNLIMMNSANTGIMIFTFKDGTFGMTEDEFFSDASIRNALLTNNQFTDYKNEPDILLGSNLYKCISLDMVNDGQKIKCYYCIKSIGNRIISVILYDDPNNSQLSTFKSMFKKWN